MRRPPVRVGIGSSLSGGIELGVGLIVGLVVLAEIDPEDLGAPGAEVGWPSRSDGRLAIDERVVHEVTADPADVVLISDRMEDLVVALIRDVVLGHLTRLHLIEPVQQCARALQRPAERSHSLPRT